MGTAAPVDRHRANDAEHRILRATVTRTCDVPSIAVPSAPRTVSDKTPADV
jgi:hypothetical protein